MSSDRKRLDDNEFLGFVIEYLKKKMGDNDKIALVQNDQKVLLIIKAEQGGES